MIKTFIHKGPKELVESGRSTLIPPQLLGRCKRRLDALNAATSLIHLDLAGLSFHSLRGKPQRYAIHVNGPWTITFEWDAPYALRVDLEQYR